MKESADSYKVGVATRSGGRRQPAACRMTVITCIDAYTAGPNTSMRQHCDLRVCEPSVAKYSRAATSIPHPRAPKMLVLCCCRIQLAKKKGKAWHLARLSHTVVGFLEYPQPGGGAHPSIPSEGVLGEGLGGSADLTLRQAH